MTEILLEMARQCVVVFATLWHLPWVGGWGMGLDGSGEPWSHGRCILR